MASNRVIGLNKQMPWHLSADLKRFKKITLGMPVLMGRKTFESIGRPLPGRTNIVISRNSDFRQEGCLVENDIEAALTMACQNAERIFVIGGATLYQALLPVADRLYITQINQAFDGDTFFPAIDPECWDEVEREDIDNDPQVSFSYSFVQLERKRLNEQG